MLKAREAGSRDEGSHDAEGREAGSSDALIAPAAAPRTSARIRRRDQKIVRTSAGRARVLTLDAGDGAPVRVLVQGGVYQSATYLDEHRFEPVFAYFRAFDALFEAEPALREAAGHGVQRVLMLGGGGFSYPKHLLTAHEGIALDVVEVDAGVVRVARRWFFLGELEERLADPARAHGNALRINIASGRAYLEAAGPASGSYDAIVNDTFVGAEPVRGLATVEAARAARRCLGPGGLYLANIVSRDEGADVGFLRDEVATFSQIFEHVHVIDASDGRFGGEANHLLVATDAPTVFADAIPYDGDFPGTPLHDVYQ